ncbi:hypothetical protein [Sphingobium sp. CFD-2]|uniref:DUF6941 family protein n=1 Tax=Sphingobium sp. CFD-2 TaxID=2878542 RepID=UPI00214BE099|nr:hypothetical protein [Sphingobium sp. CFD-2]
MIKVGNFSVNSVVLCELIRPEANNKLSILGVYSSDIVVSQFPVQLGLSAYVEFTPSKIGPCEVEFRFSAPGGNSELKSEVEVLALGQSAMPLPTVPLVVTETGPAKVEMRVNGSDWTTILEKRVIAGTVGPIPMPVELAPQ